MADMTSWPHSAVGVDVEEGGGEGGVCRARGLGGRSRLSAMVPSGVMVMTGNSMAASCDEAAGCECLRHLVRAECNG